MKKVFKTFITVFMLIAGSISISAQTKSSNAKKEYTQKMKILIGKTTLTK